MLSSIAMIAAAAVPQAAAAAVPAPAAPGLEATRGVISYPPGFFAESKPTSAYDMVLRVPGFAFDKGATVRGLAGSGGNVLLEGQPPVSKTDALDEILKRIPAGSVERIDLIRGGAPGIDMEGRTIMANVVRRQASGFRGAISPTLFVVYNEKLLPGLRFEGQWSWPGGRSAEFSQVFGTGHMLNNDLGIGQRTRFNADNSVRLASDVEAWGYGARINSTGAFETPLLGGKIRLTGALQINPGWTEIYDHYTSASGLEYQYNDINRKSLELGGRYTRTLTDRISLESVAFQSFGMLVTDVHFEGPGLTRDFLSDRKTRESVGRLQLRIKGVSNLTLEVGAESAMNRLDSATDLTINSRAILVPAANVEVKELRGEVFLRGTWRPSTQLSVDAGVRQEASRVTSAGDVSLQKTLKFLKPRAAVTWVPYSTGQVRLRIEREVGQLNFDDFVASSNVAATGTVVAGNPDLTPQQAWVYEAAYEQRFWGAGAALVTFRRFEISDTVDRGPARDSRGVIIRDPITGLPAADRPDNIGLGTKTEIQASVTLPLDRLGVHSGQLKVQSTWRDTKVIDPLDGRSREISQAHPIDWEAHYSQDIPSLNSTWGFDVIGGYRERFFRLAEIETQKFSPWVVLFTEYKPRKDLSIRIEANGATFRNSQRIREVYIGPRNLGRLDYTDVRDLEWRGSVNVRVRKTL